jgi:microcystin-dependent protein
MLRTFILLAGLTALFVAIGYMLGGSGGATIALPHRGRYEPLCLVGQ